MCTDAGRSGEGFLILEVFQGSRFAFQASLSRPSGTVPFPFPACISPTRTPELNLVLSLHKAHTMSAVQTEAKEAVTIRGS